MAARVRIEYSAHALERMRERQITRRQITQCLFEGSLAGFDIRGRKINECKINSRILVVIYLDTRSGGKVVVTTYWKGIFP
jgi:hypothetical protein